MSGQAVFWKFLKDCSKGVDGRYDISFTLNKIAQPERYTVFIFGDPQPRRNVDSQGKPVGTDRIGFKSLEMCDDMYRDMKEHAAKMTDRPVYGIALGDIVHQDLTLLPAYKAGMATTGISTYNIIGNHDHGHRLMDDSQSSKAFEAEMGPVNYSFNLGGMHYLMLDNMISPDASSGTYCDDCETGLTDAIWQWVKNDMSFVPKSTPIMVCAHSPMFKAMGTGGSPKERNGRHVSDLKNLLSKYPKSYGWAGHAHSTYNYVNKNNDSETETHTLPRVTGALWSNDYLSENGTPRGYLIFEYDNGDVSWKFKPTYYQTGSHQATTLPNYTYRDWSYNSAGRAVMKSTGANLDDSYQMQVFGPTVYGDGYIYANIFFWDEKWGKPMLTVNGIPNPMTRVVEENKMYSMGNYELMTYYEKRSSSLFTPSQNDCASMFRAVPNATTGSGTVSVQDRFGNTYTSTITW